MEKPAIWVYLCVIAISVLLICAETQRSRVSQTSNDATPVSIEIDLDRGHPVAETLYGTFFEEVCDPVRFIQLRHITLFRFVIGIARPYDAPDREC